ncbi:MAG TPA: amidase [Bryobacteraceae bacterium]|nr:amidase [Bryobacteraceae bacterium]
MHRLSRREFAAALGAAVLARAETPGDLAALTIGEAAGRIRSRSLTSTQLVNACLERIEVYNPKLNAFITVMRAEALARARELDAEQAAGRLHGPLHGVPIALKDNIDTAGIRTTGASALFDDRVPTQDAEVTRRLKNAGAVLIGKTNLNEFALGGTSATSYFGPVRNPWALDRNPGGSSGGSGAAVAADLCHGALGTDTTGSIRGPASNCGVVGLKATYGLVPIRGIIPLTLSLDHCGPITKNVEDAARLLNVLAGFDKLDISSVPHAPEDYLAGMKQPASSLRIGIPRAPFFDLVDADIATRVEDAIRVISKLTGSVKDVTLPAMHNITQALGGELYAYHEQYYTQYPTRYQLRARHILRDRANLKAADYIRARWEMELLRRTIDDAFSDFDLIVVPTRHQPPRTIDAALKLDESDTPRNPEADNNGYFNACGIPAISIPCGFNRDGLPIGLEIAGPHFSESKILALAQAYERTTEWHKLRPKLAPDTPVPPLASANQ